MAVVNKDIERNKTNTDAFQTSGNQMPVDAVPMLPWYIFRYRVLTKQLRDYFHDHSDKLYFPCYKIRKEGDTSPADGIYRERPCLPGYIFIHTPLPEAIELGREVGLNPWKKREYVSGLAHQYYSVSHPAMQRFMHVVSLYEYGVRMYDPSEIDIEPYDEVEFVSGALAGQRGYIQVEKGKSGGVVIIPFTSSQEAEDPDTPQTEEAPSPQRMSFLHYGIEAKESEFRIVRFANNTRLNDCLKSANAKVKEIFQLFSSGYKLNDRELKRLNSYLIRYADAQMTTDIQRATHALLLFRIHTMLQNEVMRTKLQQQITQEILPRYDQRIAEAWKKRKDQIKKQKTKFEKEYTQIAEASAPHA